VGLLVSDPVVKPTLSTILEMVELAILTAGRAMLTKWICWLYAYLMSSNPFWNGRKQDKIYGDHRIEHATIPPITWEKYKSTPSVGWILPHYRGWFNGSWQRSSLRDYSNHAAGANRRLLHSNKLMLNVTHLFVQEATAEQGIMCQASYRKPSCSFLRASSAISSRSNLQFFWSNLGIGSQ